MLEVKNLGKKFDNFTAVDDLSFKIEEGEILGLIGQNGAGKTTIFRMILGLLDQDQGDVRWKEKEISESTYYEIGYLPEERGLFLKESIERQLLYFAELRGKDPVEISPKIDEWLERFDVKGTRKTKVRMLSKGNQQKVQLIVTLIHEPKLIILDEPFSGLDPVNASLLEEAIFELKKKGACIIFSSHNMENVEKLADNLMMLKDGKSVLNGKVHEIRESFGLTKLFIKSELTANELRTIDGVKKVKAYADGRLEVDLSDSKVGEMIFKRASYGGYVPVFSQEAPSLEEIFKKKVDEEK